MSNPSDHAFYFDGAQYSPPRTENGKPSVGAQTEGVATVNSDAREPAPKIKCIKGRCYSPVACGGWGYCRELNFRGASNDRQD